MPVRRPWTPMPRWADDGVREGMNGLTAALDSLVRCSESESRAGRSRPSRRSPPPAWLSVGLVRGGPEDGSAAFSGPHRLPRLLPFNRLRLSPVYEGCPLPLSAPRHPHPFSVPRRTSCRSASQPLRPFQLAPGSRPHPGLRHIPCSYGSSSSKHCQPPKPFQPPDGGHGSGPSAGPPQSSLPSPPGLRCTVAGNVPKPLLPDMIRFEDHLPRLASIAELDGLIAEFHKLERSCSGTVRLYGAPKTARTAPCRTPRTPHRIPAGIR